MLRVDTARENVSAFVDMMSRAVDVHPGRLGPWLEAYFKLRCLEVMECEEAEERRKVEKTMPTPEELREVQALRKVKAQRELEAELAAETEEDTSSTVPSQSAAPTAEGELPRSGKGGHPGVLPEGEPREAAKFAGNGARTQSEVHGMLMAARAAVISYCEISAV